MGYRNGTKVGDGLKKPLQFCNIKVFIDSSIKTNITWLNCMDCQHKAILIMFGQAIPTKSGT